MAEGESFTGGLVRAAPPLVEPPEREEPDDGAPVDGEAALGEVDLRVEEECGGADQSEIFAKRKSSATMVAPAMISGPVKSALKSL
ncbi:MAG: hypothetical protein RL625_611 [Gemmatimonadota bacterium]